MKPPIQFIQRAGLSLAASAGILTAAFSPAKAADNTAYGTGALQSGTTTGVEDSAFGFDALYSTTTGVGNTATGVNALYANRVGYYNTADGVGALTENSAYENTATGFQSLHSNTTGFNNTADGAYTLYLSTTGSNNTAVGYEALYSNTTGFGNLAEGNAALYHNTSGDRNTAGGASALYGNTTGIYNTAFGFNALLTETSGSNNSAFGTDALYSDSIGVNNTAVGLAALGNVTSGSNNVGIGNSAGYDITTGNNNIEINTLGASGDTDTIRIGIEGEQTAAYIAGAYGETIDSQTGIDLGIDSTGKIGTVASSERFKRDIRDMGDTSDQILSLRPVTFRYKQEIDPKGVQQFGLVAEEVEKVNPALVVHDGHGKIYSVHYQAVYAMLLNEFLKQHGKVSKLEASNNKLEATAARLEASNTMLEATVAAQAKVATEQEQEIKGLTASLKEQGSLLQKVSLQLATSRPAPQIAANK